MAYGYYCKYKEAIRLSALFMHVFASGNMNKIYWNMWWKTWFVSKMCWPCSTCM